MSIANVFLEKTVFDQKSVLCCQKGEDFPSLVESSV